jgi:hypothetical protein
VSGSLGFPSFRAGCQSGRFAKAGKPYVPKDTGKPAERKFRCAGGILEYHLGFPYFLHMNVIQKILGLKEDPAPATAATRA